MNLHISHGRFRIIPLHIERGWFLIMIQLHVCSLTLDELYAAVSFFSIMELSFKPWL